MSVEDKHGYARCSRIHVTGADLARLRQSLYDAKLALSSPGSEAREAGLKKILEALDLTQGWT